MQQKTEKIPIKEKIAYLLANTGNIPLMSLTSSFLLIFYTNVVGLNPAAVATLFLISRIMDGINDPIMGFIIDHLPRSKMGRFRPVLIIGSIICCINYVLLWFAPVWAPAGKLTIAYISYLLLGITFDLMDIPLNSILPVMTDDTKERNTLSTLKGLGYIIGTLLITFLAPIILSDASNLAGYYMLISGSVAVVLIFSIIGALGVKERIPPVSEKQYTIMEELKILIEKPVFITFLSMMLYSIGQNITTASYSYFFTYIFGDLKIFSLVTLVTGVGIIPGILIAGPVINKIGKKSMYIFGTLIPVPFLLARYLNVHNLPLLLIAAVISGMSTGILIPMRYGMQADNTDYVILKRKQNAEAAIASLSSFITKCAQGIGGAVPGYLLALTGFNKDATVQSAGVNNAILACSIAIPAAVSTLAAIIFAVYYPITREKLAEQTEKLRALRASGETVE